MTYTQSFNAYKETGVKTASQGKLVVMLYTEAVRQLDNALDLFEADGKLPISSIEKMHKHLTKTQEILTELMVSLDMERGGEIAKNLMNLYVFFNQTLMSASINKDSKKINDIRTMMDSLRETWVTISTQTNVPAPNTHPNIDING
ncbi:MAG: flagellar export chaperone FliS [Treponema sp. CETP13]|nr:MAG: flagellar export chaperone FliS [Treponema sp. CETP13]